jgi:hypothetical protein
VDQVVDQLWDRCGEAPNLMLRLVRHRLWIRYGISLGIGFRRSSLPPDLQKNASDYLIIKKCKNKYVSYVALVSARIFPNRTDERRLTWFIYCSML